MEQDPFKNLHAELFHEFVRELEETQGRSLTTEEIAEADKLLDEAKTRGRESGNRRLATEESN